MTHFAFSYRQRTLIALNSTDCRGMFAWVYIALNWKEWDVFDWARLGFEYYYNNVLRWYENVGAYTALCVCWLMVSVWSGCVLEEKPL